MAAKHQKQPEFSRLMALEAVGEEEVTKEIEATAEERSALAARFGLLALDSLSAEFRLAWTQVGELGGGDLVRLKGRLEAEVTQACVISLKPVSSRLEEDFSLLYTTEGGAEQPGGEVVVELDQDDPPESFPSEGLDLGEVAAEQLALALNPYPRAEGVELDPGRWGGEAADQEEKVSPFAVLATLKKP